MADNTRLSVVILFVHLTNYLANCYYQDYKDNRGSEYGLSRFDDYYYDRAGYGGGHGGGGYGGGGGGGYGGGVSNALELLAIGALTLAALAILTAILGAVLSALGLIAQGNFAFTPATLQARNSVPTLFDRNGTSIFDFGFESIRNIIESIG